MTIVLKDFAASTLTAGLASGATGVGILQVTDGSKFPSFSSQHIYLVLEDASKNREIIKVDGRATNAMDIPVGGRGLGGTVTRDWNAGDIVSLRWVKPIWDDLIAEHLAAADPHPGYALDTDLTAHLSDTTAAHAASAISYAGSTGLAATDVESALDELDTETVKLTGDQTVAGIKTFSSAPVLGLGSATKSIFTTQQTPMSGALTDGATIDWNGNTNGQVVTLTLGGNRTMNAPTNIQQYAMYLLRVTQDATGSRTITWDAAYKFGSSGAPTLTTTASKTDFLSFIGGAGNTLEFLGYRLNAV